MPSKLAISRLNKSFGDLEALRSIDLAIERGEFLSVVGPSGCGKTTFLRIIAGLEEASSGEVRLDGHLVRKPGGDRGFVFQNDNLLPWRDVFANAMIGREISGRTGPAQRKHTMDLLKLVGLKGFEHYYPRQLSGGMRQRVNLARALAIDPEILLMDEPFSALDAQTREIMQTELLRIWEEGRKTVAVRHPPDRRSGLFVRPRTGVRAPARPAAGRGQDRIAAAARSGHEAHAGIRNVGRSHLATDRRRRAGSRTFRERLAASGSSRSRPAVRPINLAASPGPAARADCHVPPPAPFSWVRKQGILGAKPPHHDRDRP